jgi:predicted DNA binding CopG/RHH family protein
MKREYDLKKLKKRPGKVKFDKRATKTPISIRLDAAVLAALRTQALRLGLPYQTFVSSVLYRYTQGELVDKNSPEFQKMKKGVS